MPYTVKQHKYFEAVAHGMKPQKRGLTKDIAARMASEGIKRNPKTVRKTLYPTHKESR